MLSLLIRYKIADNHVQSKVTGIEGAQKRLCWVAYTVLILRAAVCGRLLSLSYSFLRLYGGTLLSYFILVKEEPLSVSGCVGILLTASKKWQNIALSISLLFPHVIMKGWMFTSM